MFTNRRQMIISALAVAAMPFLPEAVVAAPEVTNTREKPNWVPAPARIGPPSPSMLYPSHWRYLRADEWRFLPGEMHDGVVLVMIDGVEYLAADGYALYNVGESGGTGYCYLGMTEWSDGVRRPSYAQVIGEW